MKGSVSTGKTSVSKQIISEVDIESGFSKKMYKKDAKPKFGKQISHGKKKRKQSMSEIKEDTDTLVAIPKQKKYEKSQEVLKNPKSKFSKSTGRSNVNKNGKKNHTISELPANVIGSDGKPKWDKVKLDKKKLRKDRKIHRTGADQYQLSVKAKNIWERLRKKAVTKGKKDELVDELFNLLKGQISHVVHSHDMARVVQWMIKLGSPSIRKMVCEELCSTDIIQYLQSKYASHCIQRALRYGSKTNRTHIIETCKGHFLKLFNHSYASPIMDQIYSIYASADQRKQIHREMYGEMHVLLPPGVTAIESIPKDMKPAILASTKTNLTKLLEKKDKIKSTLLQSVLIDFLTSCSDQDRKDIFELIEEDILELLSTKEGSRVALLVVWHATNKMKKVIVKQLKGKVKEIATSEAGHIFLMAIFDCIDDTVLLKKALIPEIISEVAELVNNELGRRVILYLVAHRDPAYFHPQQIEILSKGDTISTGKKDAAVREQEMLEAVSGPLLEKIAKDPVTWFSESSIAMFSLAVMKTGKGQSLHAAFEKLADYILDPNSMVEVNNRTFHVIEHSALHLVFKKLIQQDQAQPDRTTDTFSKILVSKLTEESLNHMLQFNRGCFLLVLLFESNDKKIIKKLKSKMTAKMTTFLQKQETTGSKILLKKLSE